MTICHDGILLLSAGRALPFGTTRHCAAFSSAFGNDKSQLRFKVLGRDLAYSGWRRIVKKTVCIEDEKEYVFDVVHQVLYYFLPDIHEVI